MWKIIDKERYIAIRTKEQRVFEGFTDVDGDCPFGNGRPYMETVWGNPATDLPEVKIIMTKEYRSQAEWDYQYFEYLAPAKNAINEPENV